MTDLNINYSHALKNARGGDNILIICNNAFDAANAAQWLFDKASSAFGAIRKGRNTVFIGDGSIEFGWVETRTGRRLDDYQETGFGIYDPFDVDAERQKLILKSKIASGKLTINDAREVLARFSKGKS